MTPTFNVVAGLLAVAAVGYAGHWIGRDSVYLDGFTAGNFAAQTLCDKSTALLLVTARNDVESKTKELNAKYELERKRLETEMQAAQQAGIESVAAADRRADDLLERVRSLERARKANSISAATSGARVPEAAAVGIATDYAEWLVSPRGGESVIRMARESERTAAQLDICSRYTRSLLQGN